MTISFNALGNLGHLGNQMFQYAFLLGMARKYDVSFCIPHQSHFGGAYYQELKSNLYEAFGALKLEGAKGISSYPTVRESHFHFDQSLFEGFNSAYDTNFYGFFQSSKWFEHIDNEIRSAYTFKEEYEKEAQGIYDGIWEGMDKESRYSKHKEVASLHIRRGDYITNPNHPLLGLDYYSAALSFIPDRYVLIFTDDVEWVQSPTSPFKKIEEKYPGDKFIISETNSPYTDMALMAKCQYHIIANSSFSWWGAYLAQSQQVVAPREWFGDTTKDTRDLYCKGWKVL